MRSTALGGIQGRPVVNAVGTQPPPLSNHMQTAGFLTAGTYRLSLRLSHKAGWKCWSFNTSGVALKQLGREMV